jgi:CRP/FNR family transcriptional regulator/CRP/FNR family cyclic AMP-dependent transcriptional regulator
VPLRRTSDKIELLKRVPLFKGLSNKHLGMIAKGSDEIKVLSGRIIAKQGSMRREVFIIIDGKGRVERDGKLIARLKRGDSFGEMSLIDGQPRSATVTAEGDVNVLVVDPRSFLALMDSAPALSRKVMAALSERLRLADIQLASRN